MMSEIFCVYIRQCFFSFSLSLIYFGWVNMLMLCSVYWLHLWYEQLPPSAIWCHRSPRLPCAALWGYSKLFKYTLQTMASLFFNAAALSTIWSAELTDCQQPFVYQLTHYRQEENSMFTTKDVIKTCSNVIPLCVCNISEAAVIPHNMLDVTVWIHRWSKSLQIIHNSVIIHQSLFRVWCCDSGHGFIDSSTHTSAPSFTPLHFQKPLLHLPPGSLNFTSIPSCCTPAS